LTGTTVVALEHAVAAPLCTRQLADLGARVIKIEAPNGGDFARSYDGVVHGSSSYFTWVNRGKESVVLDLKTSADMAAMSTLLDHSDVLVQNLGPGAVGRLGLDHASVRADRPRLIALDIVGWGAPWSDRKAYDLLVQSESGLASLTGGTDPIRVGISVADIAAGMYGTQAVLAALVRRGITGEGSHCTVSLFDSLAEWLTQPALIAWATGEVPPPAGLAHATIAPYGAFTCYDSVRIVIAVQNDTEWQNLCRSVLNEQSLISDDRFASNAGRVRHRTEVDRHVAQWAGTVRADHAESALDEAGIAHARVRGVDELLAHPLLVERVVNIGVGGGFAPALPPPIRFDDVVTPMGQVPALGADTARVLTEFGIAGPDAHAAR
jgi:formyl-CoA transferase